ncbi:MAG: type II CAAX endopeptidase family protein [Oscillospiraceae bacterium]|nr:type II CAAX endopeptidase family protein [Oscillospiraceae bacterium]
MEKCMEKTKFQYAANIAAFSVALFLTLSMAFKYAIGFILKLLVPGASLANPVGMPVWAAAFISMVYTFTVLAIPIVFVRKMQTAAMPVKVKLGKIPRLQGTKIAAVFFLCYSAASFVSGGLRLLLQKLINYPAAQGAQLPKGGVAFLLAFITMCVLPAFMEEYLFRGLLQGMLVPWGQRFAIVTVSVLFTLSHSDMSQMPTIFISSYLLGYAAVCTGGLRLSVVLHFMNNLFAFLAAYAQQNLDAASALLLLSVVFTLYIGGGLLALWYLRAEKLPRLQAVKVPQNRQSRFELMATAPVCAFSFIIAAAYAVLRSFILL